MTVSARLRAARGLATAFAATSAAHLGAIATGATVLQNTTKPALMPLLAAHSLASAERAPKLLAPALLASTAGDVLLQLGGNTAFLAGMGSFAAAHVAYVTMFAEQGAFTDRRRTLLVAAGYAAAWAAVISQLWPDLGGLQIPVAVYSLLLASTAVSSAGLGLATGIGGGLFLLSDSLIAVRLAGWKLLPGHNVLVMATYIAAQYLLARGALRAEAARTEPRAADGTAGVRLGAPA
ncbi:lysoplasmalogenase [Kitasatospora sp. DSM 101779]|uniref:lysoplasmalogenase n=1 Tax=Kitasatospora sp. DSM 101779 TaxID=2853165 RepID=UPI0037EF4A99|nr:lysoplasmalogenase [Kitasatospora sp. DSM 101779]